jgi:hypothetical protein
MKSSLDTLKKKVFNEKDFQEASRVDRLRMYLIDPANITLNNRDQEYLNKLSITFNVLCDAPRQKVAVQKLKILLDPPQSTDIIEYIRDAQEVFSNIITRNTYFDKVMQRERLLKHLEFCEKTDRLKEVIQIEALIAKIDTEIHSLQPDNKKATAVLPTFKLSIDPSILAQSSSNFLANHQQDEEE